MRFEPFPGHFKAMKDKGTSMTQIYFRCIILHLHLY